MICKLFLKDNDQQKDPTLEVINKLMKANTTSDDMPLSLRNRNGLKRLIVYVFSSDIATYLKSTEFLDFSKSFNIIKLLASTYYQQSNGSVERLIQTVKTKIATMETNRNDGIIGVASK